MIETLKLGTVVVKALQVLWALVVVSQFQKKFQFLKKNDVIVCQSVFAKLCAESRVVCVCVCVSHSVCCAQTPDSFVIQHIIKQQNV